ncbi:MAG: SUMF1/EgtB/PvdO family nonheme iron enzyme, partial [Planctomycetes bacterium]|nr:SUMF1/EgtB/PvdO family nonheme iron enzyme [Planctomycetota bacterium]
LFVRGARREGEPAPNAAALALEPFRGLLAYDEEHAAIFFGREEETEAALARLSERSALFVYGASGSGKSSWLRAGIVPALRARAALAGRALTPIVLVPGDRPLAALRRAVTDARGGTPEEASRWSREVDATIPPKSTAAHERGLVHLLRGLAAQGALPVLVVDQMEEAAMLPLHHEEGRAFLTLVATAAASAKDAGAVVLASARADLLAPLLEHQSVRTFLDEHGAAIGSIATERLARVIVEPLRGRRVQIEAGLAETILADVADEPGSLALLSQVLTTLWSERGRFGGALTKQGYVDAGRVAGALERQAEAALAEACAQASMSPGTAIEKRVDRLFRGLAATDEGERFTRRRVALATLASELGATPDEIRTLTQPFVARRLVVLAAYGRDETIEVAHERLLIAWPRLANLLASEREVLQLRAEIEAAAAAWRASGKRREMWSDSTSKLRRGEELLAAGRLDVDARGLDFMAASRNVVRRRKRIERSVLVALLLFASAAGYGVWFARQATAREREVKERAIALVRKGMMRNLMHELEYFDSLDDDVYDYARQQVSPAHVWWWEEAKRLIENVLIDPETGQEWSVGLRAAGAELARLRERARPRSLEQQESDRRSDPRWGELESAHRWLQWERRMLGLETWPDEHDAESDLGETLPTDAIGLNDMAWRLVSPDYFEPGNEQRGVALARRALALATEAQRASVHRTLAWALYSCGQFESGRTEVQHESQATPEADRAKFEVYQQRFLDACARWTDPALRAAQEERITSRAARVVELEEALRGRLIWEFEDFQDGWWHRELVKLQDGRRRLEQQIAHAQASVLEPAAVRAWREAIDAIASSDRYRGVIWPGGDRLTPQVGIVPIGPDPDSGLWEFSHLMSGTRAMRGTEGRVRITESTGIIFVLLPGGQVPIAANQADRQEPSLTSVALDPFFLSKFELTDAQWRRIGGWYWLDLAGRGPLYPKTGVSWDDCRDVLSRTGWLRLPSEAQWEYGCRAETTTTWWTGDRPEDLRGVANSSFSIRKTVSLLPIGSLRPNRFGLHDVHGNVWEWCQDMWADSVKRRAGDGVWDPPSAGSRVMRGGGHIGGASDARSSYRIGQAPDQRNGVLGLRPARGITP